MAAFDVKESEDIVMEAFKSILGRAAEQQAIDYYSKHIVAGGTAAVSNLYRNLADSDEYLHKVLGKRHLTVMDSNADKRLIDDTRHEAIDFKNLYPLEKMPETLAGMKAFCTYPGQFEYIETHTERFRELFGLVTYFSNENARMCEVSTSPASCQLKRIFKGYYVTCDHPGTYPYMNQPNPHVNSDKHFQINLNAEELNKKFSEYNTEKFDLILFTEIIEHLLKSPFDLMDDLAACLKPGGHVFISTPNLFSHGAMRLMSLKQHPTSLLARGDSFARGAHHVREYSVNELKRVIKDSGLELVHFSFSDCWDKWPELKTFLNDHPDQRSCMYLIARKPVAA